jgi:DNA-binding NtrC family response regulator
VRILIVDDEWTARRSLERILKKLSFVEVVQAASLDEARLELDKGAIDVALIDLRLDQDGQSRDGLTLLSEVRQRTSAVPIVVSGSSDLAEVRAAMRVGAYDYILKDELSEDLVLPIVEKLHSVQALEQEVRRLRARRDVSTTPGLVGASPQMQRLRDDIERVAMSDRPVLVTGPTGAGKELVVRAVHALSARADQPLLDLNCGALPGSLIESELFGHERGAFTGADRKHSGFFSAVRGGTLFLDEIAEMPIELQAKLLRVLESGMFRPIGASALLRFEGRVVAATHCDLEARTARGAFREDLYYRLNVLEVRVPSLEERREDIPALVAHFTGMQTRAITFTEPAIGALQSAPWPGNVRQLRNVVDRLTVFAPEGPITPEIIAELGGGKRPRDAARGLADFARAVLQTAHPEKLSLAENCLIDEAMRLCDGNKAAAARLLGVHRKVVERRLDRKDLAGKPEPDFTSLPDPSPADAANR